MDTHQTPSKQSQESARKPQTAKPPEATPAQEAAPRELRQALENPSEAQPAALLTLQHTHGNRAVQRMVDGTSGFVQRADMPEEDEELQRKPEGAGLVQRADIPEEEEELQKKPDGGAAGGGPLSPDLEDSIQRMRGSGQALDRGARAQLEPAFGTDFSGVRVHTDAEADHLNQSLSAKAFTIGSDIFFRQGNYDPGSSSGRELLAHELTHVVQQGGGQAGPVQAKLTVGPVGDEYEQEADQVAQQVTSTGAPGSQGPVQREAPPEEEELQKKPLVQREAAPEEEELQMKPEGPGLVQREAAPEEEELQMKPEAAGRVQRVTRLKN